jgi:hypothetical protein
MERRYHHSQIPRDRGLPGKHGDATLFNATEDRMNLITLGDNPLRQCEITLMQRNRRIIDHSAGQPDHPRQVGNQPIQLGMKGGPHYLHLLSTHADGSDLPGTTTASPMLQGDVLTFL